MRYLFTLLLLLRSFEAYGQVGFTPSVDGITAKIVGGETIHLLSDIEAGRVVYFPKPVFGNANCNTTGVELIWCHSIAGSPDHAWVRPYKTLDGTWFLDFSVAITYGVNQTTALWEINGITNTNFTSFAVSCANSGVGASQSLGSGFFQGGSGLARSLCANARPVFGSDGTMRLSSKPLWIK